MNKSEQIREGLRQLAERHGPAATMLAQVRSVSEEEGTCILYDADTGQEYPEVRLRPVLNGSESLTLFPSQDSWALAIRIEQEDDWMLVAASSYTKWRLCVGTSVIEQDETGLNISKGTDSLLEVLRLIIEAVQKIVVLQGQNPDYVKLSSALTKANNLLR